jgi:hypothetical protein
LKSKFSVILITTLLVMLLIPGCSKTNLSPGGELVDQSRFDPPKIKSSFPAKEVAVIPAELHFYEQAAGNSEVYSEVINYDNGKTGYKIYFCTNESYTEIQKKMYLPAKSLGWQQTAFYAQDKYYAYEAIKGDDKLIILSHGASEELSCTTIQTK